MDETSWFSKFIRKWLELRFEMFKIEFSVKNNGYRDSQIVISYSLQKNDFSWRKATFFLRWARFWMFGIGFHICSDSRRFQRAVYDICFDETSKSLDIAIPILILQELGFRIFGKEKVEAQTLPRQFGWLHCMNNDIKKTGSYILKTKARPIRFLMPNVVENYGFSKFGDKCLELSFLICSIEFSVKIT